MEYLDKFMEFMQQVWGMWQTQFLVYHILLNTIVAVAASFYVGEFRLGRLGEFLYKKLLPYVLLFAGFSLFGAAVGKPGVATAAWAAIEALLVGDLMDNLKAFGLPIPDWTTK